MISVQVFDTAFSEVEAHLKKPFKKRSECIGTFQSCKNLKRKGYFLSENIIQFDFVTFSFSELRRKQKKMQVKPVQNILFIES